MTAEKALYLTGATSLPARVGSVYRELGYTLESSTRIKRPAITWRHRGVVCFRPGGWKDVREALAHELGHICGDHPGDGHFCEARAWESLNPIERGAHHFAEALLMPVPLLTPWFEPGGRISLSRLACMSEVSFAFARRRIRRACLEKFVWDDTVPGAHLVRA